MKFVFGKEFLNGLVEVIDTSLNNFDLMLMGELEGLAKELLSDSSAAVLRNICVLKKFFVI